VLNRRPHSSAPTLACVCGCEVAMVVAVAADGGEWYRMECARCGLRTMAAPSEDALRIPWNRLQFELGQAHARGEFDPACLREVER
jgi:hypothetical protein